MKRLYAVLFVVAGIMVAGSTASAQMMRENPMVGGAAMYPSKTIVANAMNSADHTTLVAAVKGPGWSTHSTAQGRSLSLRQPTPHLPSYRPELSTLC